MQHRKIFLYPTWLFTISNGSTNPMGQLQLRKLDQLRFDLVMKCSSWRHVSLTNEHEWQHTVYRNQRSNSDRRPSWTQRFKRIKIKKVNNIENIKIGFCNKGHRTLRLCFSSYIIAIGIAQNVPLRLGGSTPLEVFWCGRHFKCLTSIYIAASLNDDDFR